MKSNPLLQPKGPWLHVLVATESETCDRIAALCRPAMVVARLIRGHKATTTGALFDQFAAALQFPYYFGENWDALNDCLHDLEWLPGKAYVIFIMNSNRLLEGEDPKERRQLLQLLAQVGEAWAKPVKVPHPRPAIGFHTVLQCTPGDEADVHHTLQTARVAHDAIK